jgi:hypothetical protein
MLNTNIPLIYAEVDMEYVTHGNIPGWKECIIFGVASIPGHALLFHCQISNGAVYYRLPIDKFRNRTGAKLTPMPINKLQAWNCASLEISCITYEWLYNQRVTYTREQLGGTYLFTLDWTGRGTTAEVPEEHKCAHVIVLDNGQYAALPNNYLIWHEPSNIVVDGSHRMLRSNREYSNVEK